MNIPVIICPCKIFVRNNIFGNWETRRQTSQSHWHACKILEYKYGCMSQLVLFFTFSLKGSAYPDKMLGNEHSSDLLGDVRSRFDT
mgnify:FL=1